MLGGGGQFIKDGLGPLFRVKQKRMKLIGKKSDNDIIALLRALEENRKEERRVEQTNLRINKGIEEIDKQSVFLYIFLVMTLSPIYR